MSRHVGKAQWTEMSDTLEVPVGGGRAPSLRTSECTKRRSACHHLQQQPSVTWHFYFLSFLRRLSQVGGASKALMCKINNKKALRNLRMLFVWEWNLPECFERGGEWRYVSVSSAPFSQRKSIFKRIPPGRAVESAPVSKASAGYWHTMLCTVM